MSRDVSTPTFSAIAIPLDVTVWEQQSTYTQAGSKAGVPVPTDGEGASRLGLEARGAQTATGGIDVRTQRGGFAAREAQLSGTLILDNGATFVWRTASVSAGVTTTGSWRGWDPPHSVTRWQSMLVCDSAATTVRTSQDAHAITLQSGAVLVAVQVYDTSQASPYQIAIWQRSGVSDTWARVTSPYGSTTAPTANYHPTMCQLPSGRVLLFYSLYQASGPRYPIAGWYSDDDGATWSFLGDGLTNTVPSADIGHMRCAYKDGQVLLLINNAAGGRVNQYASSNSGNSFNFVEEYVPASAISNIDITVVPSGFLVGIQDAVPSTTVRLLGDAYTPISGVTAITSGLESAKGNGDFALCTDETGVVYAYLRPSTVTAGHVDPYISFDGGLNWTQYADDLSSIFMATGTYPRAYCVTAVRGQVLLIGNNTSSAAAYDASLSCWTLGGYTTVCMPRYQRNFGQASVLGWDLNYCPIELPANVGWTTTSTGGSAESIATGGLVVTSAGGTQYYSANPAADYNRGIIARFVLSVGVGAALGQELSAEIILESGGATDTGVRIEWTTSTWRLWDLGAGAAVGATQTYTAGTVEVLVHIAARAVATWWRRVDTTAESGVRAWTTGPTSTTLTQAALAAGNDLIRWGHIAAGTRTSTWLEVAYAYSLDSTGLSAGQTSPDDLYGRAYASSTDGVYVGKNVTIQARGGPTWLGEAFGCQPRADSALERAISLPSPRMPWVATTTSEIVALLMDDGVALGTEDLATPGLIAIYLGDCNAETVIVKRRVVSGGTWTSMGTANRCITGGGSNGLGFDCHNKTIRPGARDDGLYLRTNELVGCWFVDADAGYTYKIASNTEGRWNADARLRPVIITETTAEGSSTNNNGGKIVPKDSVILVDLSGYDTPALQLTLACPSGSAIRCGVLRIARLAGLGHRYDWGRNVDLDLGGVEIAEARDRTRRARSSGPPRRVVSVSWANTAIDQTDADTWGDPDWIMGSTDGTAAIGSTAGTAYAIEGLVREVAGAAEPVIYLPSVPMGSGLRVLNRRHQMLWCRITSDLSIENVLGDEDRNELVRVATVELSEEL